jgi:hypothetical protein
MKARIEVLEFLTKANHTARTKEQWILGWKCSKELIKGTAEDDVREQTTVCVGLLLGGSLIVSLSKKPVDIAST